MGVFAPLFRFLAPRFLSNPDHVMDVERQHATWQRVLQRRRALKLKSLNAWLKLSDQLRDGGELPPSQELKGDTWSTSREASVSNSTRSRLLQSSLMACEPCIGHASPQPMWRL